MVRSSVWDAEQARIRDAANRKRSEATKQQPRSDDGTRLASGPGTTSADTDSRDHKGEEATRSRTAKAKASGTNRGAVERMDALGFPSLGSPSEL